MIKRYFSSIKSALLLSGIIFVTIAHANQSMVCSDLSATEIHQKMIEKKLTAISCTNELIKLIDKYDRNDQKSGYNTFIAYHKKAIFDQAKELDQTNNASENLLHGIPVVIKDNIDVEGYPTTDGTISLERNFPKTDAIAVQKLKQAGAIILGKTNMDELAAGVTSNNFVYGAVKNPYDKGKFPGGSSGGTAAAIRLGFAPIGLGSDTAGSIRIPASLSGIVGFRPSITRYPTEGIIPASPTFDTVGTMAKNVEDIILLDKVITQAKTNIQPVSLKGLRLGVPREYFYENLDPETRRLTEETLKKLQHAGVILVEENISHLQALIDKESLSIALYEFPLALTHYLPKKELKLTFTELINQVKSPYVKSAFLPLIEHPVSKMGYENAIKEGRPALQEAYKNYFGKNNIEAIIFPTTPLPARSIEGSMDTVELNGKQVPTVPIYTRNTIPSANVGLSSITLPIGLTKEGLPVGIELDGKIDQDGKLLGIALSVEKLLGSLPKPQLH